MSADLIVSSLAHTTRNVSSLYAIHCLSEKMCRRNEEGESRGGKGLGEGLHSLVRVVRQRRVVRMLLDERPNALKLQFLYFKEILSVFQ